VLAADSQCPGVPARGAALAGRAAGGGGACGGVGGGAAGACQRGALIGGPRKDVPGVAFPRKIK